MAGVEKNFQICVTRQDGVAEVLRGVGQTFPAEGRTTREITEVFEAGGLRHIGESDNVNGIGANAGREMVWPRKPSIVEPTCSLDGDSMLAKDEVEGTDVHDVGCPFRIKDDNII